MSRELSGSRLAAQSLLGRLLAALGPVTLDIMVDYLRLPPAILLGEVQLLQSIATLLPQLSRRITQTLTEIIQDLVSGKDCAFEHAAVLSALNAFPLNGPFLVSLGIVVYSPDGRPRAGEAGSATCTVEPRRREGQARRDCRVAACDQPLHRHR